MTAKTQSQKAKNQGKTPAKRVHQELQKRILVRLVAAVDEIFRAKRWSDIDTGMARLRKAGELRQTYSKRGIEFDAKFFAPSSSPKAIQRALEDLEHDGWIRRHGTAARTTHVQLTEASYTWAALAGPGFDDAELVSYMEAVRQHENHEYTQKRGGWVHEALILGYGVTSTPGKDIPADHVVLMEFILAPALVFRLLELKQDTIARAYYCLTDEGREYLRGDHSLLADIKTVPNYRADLCDIYFTAQSRWREKMNSGTVSNTNELYEIALPAAL